MSLHSYYQGQVGTCQMEIRRLQNKLNSLAVLRVLVFACFAWSVDVLIHQFSVGWLVSAILSAAAFITCVNIYLRWKDHRRLQEKLRFVSENELLQLNGAENGFPRPAYKIIRPPVQLPASSVLLKGCCRSRPARRSPQ